MLDWYALLSGLMIAWCGIDAGIAIERKNKSSIVFNAIIIVIEIVYLFGRSIIFQ